MPIYEFECTQCEKRFDRLLPASEIAMAFVKCPKCGGQTRRIFSPVASFMKKVEPHGFYPPERIDVRS